MTEEKKCILETILENALRVYVSLVEVAESPYLELMRLSNLGSNPASSGCGGSYYRMLWEFKILK